MTQTTRPLRVLLAKVGLDGHDRGVKVIARLLRQNGHEVIYLGRRQDPANVARVAADEDVAVIGLSILAGTHGDIVRQVREALMIEGIDDLPLVIGGTVLRREIPALRAAGVAAVFPVGTPLGDVATYFDELAAAART